MFFDPLLLAVPAALLLLFLLRGQVHTVVVEPHESVLLFRNGRDQGLLEPGVHRFFFGHVHAVRFDRRELQQKVGGQEVLTRDRVPVKLTVLVRFRIADPLRAHGAVVSVEDHVHTEAQLALRAAVGERELEPLLEDRGSLSQAVALSLGEGLGRAGLEMVSAVVQDVMVGGELKRAFAEVARARAEGQAKLERARGEAAALRALTNAARLFEEHAGLDRLRALDIAARAVEGQRSTLVMGLGEILRG